MPVGFNEIQVEDTSVGTIVTLKIKENSTKETTTNSCLKSKVR